MVRPTVSVPAERLYASLGPLRDQDSDYGWPLLHLCEAVTAPLAVVDLYAADWDDDFYEDGFSATYAPVQPGWSRLLHVDRAPAGALPYLAQYIGVELPPTIPEAPARALIRDAGGWRRGTVYAIKATAQAWLTDTRAVAVTERYLGSAYKIRVRVKSGELVDLDRLTEAVAAAIPAGILLTIDVVDTWTYDDLETIVYAGDTWADVEAEYGGLTYADFENREAPI